MKGIRIADPVLFELYSVSHLDILSCALSKDPNCYRCFTPAGLSLKFKEDPWKCAFNTIQSIKGPQSSVSWEQPSKDSYTKTIPKCRPRCVPLYPTTASLCAVRMLRLWMVFELNWRLSNYADSLTSLAVHYLIYQYEQSDARIP